MSDPGAVLRLVIAYDGTDFRGFAAQRGQPDIRTVAGVLEDVDCKMHEIDYVPCYRSPAGTGTANGFYWWEFDPTYYVIRAMAAVGLAWDLQPVPERIYIEARETRARRELREA